MTLLDSTALARTLGFLQGAKNTGLVLGYAIGPTIAGIMPGDTGYCPNSNHCGHSQAALGFDDMAQRFQSTMGLLGGIAICVGLAALSLRLLGSNAIQSEVSSLLPKSKSEPPSKG